MTKDWSRLFATGGFRWQMGLRTGDAHLFFAGSPGGSEVLAERRQCLDQRPEDHAALTDAGRPLLAETWQFAVSLVAPVPAAENGKLLALGCALDPDFVLLAPSAAGPVVTGGVVCFPSSWSLPEKVGLTLEQTHSPVPALNPELGDRIRTALDRLPPGVAW